MTITIQVFLEIELQLKKMRFINCSYFSQSLQKLLDTNNTFNLQNHTLCTFNRLRIKPVFCLPKYQVQSSPQWFWGMRKNISDPNSLFLTHFHNQQPNFLLLFLTEKSSRHLLIVQLLEHFFLSGSYLKTTVSCSLWTKLYLQNITNKFRSTHNAVKLFMISQ